MKYEQWLDNKMQDRSQYGFEPTLLPEYLFDFQRSLVEWVIRQGRAGIFADCGLGKTPMELVWAQNVQAETKKPVLLLAPLAVTAQTVREAEKFGVELARSSDGTVDAPLVITNYERLHYFDPKQFSGVVCDESSILKSFDGSRRDETIRFMRKTKYRLLATATAAPNDYIELGNSSEALGQLGFTDMLTRFFKNDQNNVSIKRLYGEAPKWRFKGHAEQPFWRWVTSWARACRKPSDLGFEDGRFMLPALHEREHVIDFDKSLDGKLFALPAATLPEQREERRRTITERCERVAELADHDQPVMVWCHLNDEGNLLEKIIPDAVQVSGSDSNEKKEERLIGFANGDIRVLVTKPKIGAWGLNYQHCNHIVYFPSHSYEQYYQAVRRCWRFGQEREVYVDLVMTEGERRVMENLKRKSLQADKMFENLVVEMNDALKIPHQNKMTRQVEMPQWL